MGNRDNIVGFLSTDYLYPHRNTCEQLMEYGRLTNGYWKPVFSKCPHTWVRGCVHYQGVVNNQR